MSCSVHFQKERSIQNQNKDIKTMERMIKERDDLISIYSKNEAKMGGLNKQQKLK